MNHKPVLNKEITQELAHSGMKTFFDGTLGLGGHAKIILETYSDLQYYVATDADKQHLQESSDRLEKWNNKTNLYHDNFSSIKEIMTRKKYTSPVVYFLDLGVCSHHLDNPEKGFTYSADGPLDMRFNRDIGQSVQAFLKEGSEVDIARVIQKYGEERRAKYIAQSIKKSVDSGNMQSTKDLREAVEVVTRIQDQKKTLTRVFQAFRIYVNDELQVIERFLLDIEQLLSTDDRVGIISYHSLEDRIVKQKFMDWSRPETAETEKSLHTIVTPAKGEMLTKKPITPSEQEIAQNPRSRSAKLRIYRHF